MVAQASTRVEPDVFRLLALAKQTIRKIFTRKEFFGLKPFHGQAVGGHCLAALTVE